MFRTAELGRAIPKREFNKQVPVLRQELLAAQRALSEFDRFPVILVFAGVHGAGKTETINLLNAWMDPRWLVTRAYDAPSDEESERPEYWRYWRDLPPKGRIGLFLSSWYSKPVLDHAYGNSDDALLNECLDRIINFENALADDNALILKFWMHLSPGDQKKRLKKLERDPLTSWRVSKKDWDHWQIYDKFESTAEKVIVRSSTGKARWLVVEGKDPNYRSLKVGTTIRDEILKRIAELRSAEIQAVSVDVGTASAQENGLALESPENDSVHLVPSEATPAPLQHVTLFSTLDMTQVMTKSDYRKALAAQQARLNQLHREAQTSKVSTILVFEGQDAAGKGGAIRRVTQALDARFYQVIPIAAPTDEERAQHYLWRFWRHLSRAGRVTFFDRSWYGRMLVERVEGFATEDEWRRAYVEVNHFEKQLTDHGNVVVKFWVYITKDEQLARFKAREETPHKRWKLTEEDWRNREKWGEYEEAANDILQYTNTQDAPWVVVEGNDKRFARIKVLKAVADRLEARLSGLKNKREAG